MAETYSVAVAQKDLQGYIWKLHVPVIVPVPLWLREREGKRQN